jgi:hypothetical protein
MNGTTPAQPLNLIAERVVVNDRHTRTLIGDAPHGGGRVTLRCSGDYNYAGVIRTGDQWQIVAKGYDQGSVYNRTRALRNRGLQSRPFDAIALREAHPAKLDGYFGLQVRPCVTRVFRPADGWVNVERVAASSYTLRQIKRAGYTAVGIINWMSGRPAADFELTELV